MNSQPERTALIVGSTGLIGSQLLLALSKDSVFTHIKAISRKPIIGLPRRAEDIVVDFNNEVELKKALKGTDLFFCFGTTLKSAGSKEKFIEIEWGYSKKVLEAASESGVKNLYLVSSVGASTKSSVLYYSIKGQIEELARHLKFESVYILRPSLLLGKRRDNRLGEAVAKTLSRPLAFMFVGPLLEYRAIESELVANRMVELSHNPKKGIHLIKNDTLHEGLFPHSYSHE